MDSITSWKKFLKQVKVEGKIETVYNTLSIEIMAELYAKLENLDYKVCKVFMNAGTYAAIRKWNRYPLDFETRRDRVKRGFMAKIWGADIIVQKAVPNSTLVAVFDEMEVEKKMGRVPPKKPVAAIMILGRGTSHTKRLKVVLESVAEMRSYLDLELARTSKVLKILIEECEKEEAK